MALAEPSTTAPNYLIGVLQALFDQLVVQNNTLKEINIATNEILKIMRIETNGHS